MWINKYFICNRKGIIEQYVDKYFTH